MRIEVLKNVSIETMRQLLAMRQKAFPMGWQEYSDAEDFYRAEISNPENIALALWREDELVGFLLAMPHNKVRTELAADDPLMPEDDSCFYVETMHFIPELTRSLAGGKWFFRMLHRMIEEAQKRGVNRFTMHAMSDSGMSIAVQKHFGRIMKVVRRIDNWKWNGGHPSDYMLGVVDEELKPV